MFFTGNLIGFLEIGSILWRSLASFSSEFVTLKFSNSLENAANRALSSKVVVEHRKRFSWRNSDIITGAMKILTPSSGPSRSFADFQQVFSFPLPVRRKSCSLKLCCLPFATLIQSGKYFQLLAGSACFVLNSLRNLELFWEETYSSGSQQLLKLTSILKSMHEGGLKTLENLFDLNTCYIHFKIIFEKKANCYALHSAGAFIYVRRPRGIMQFCWKQKK